MKSDPERLKKNKISKFSDIQKKSKEIPKLKNPGFSINFNYFQVQNGLILQDFNGEPEPIYEFYEEQYVQQVPTEIEETPTIKQQSIPYENLHFEHVEAAPGPSEPHLQVVAEGEILYDGEEIVDISNGKSLKEEIQNGDANIYGMIQDLLVVFFLN